MDYSALVSAIDELGKSSGVDYFVAFSPIIISLIGIVILIIAIFLPYLTAVGELSEYINTYSNTIAIEDSDVTLGDLAKVPFISVSKLVTSVWGEDDAQVTDIFLIVFVNGIGIGILNLS